MATEGFISVEELKQRLQADELRFDETLLANSFSSLTVLNDKQAQLVTFYYRYVDLMAKATTEASSFKYTDGEESVDKSNVSKNYRDLAQHYYDLWSSERAEYDGSGSNFRIAKRVDRP
ncbi:hypothetical protein CN936_25560 [Bacillus cereus]|uniref:hypothetical protein n=1 Tax=Bacillus cereus TaxID=1396 RepID=UPI000BF6C06F|nr:hypothetical protein [Bacillus cereus]PFR72939.1 hypothetical protein COK29_22510 [Bacillus cereus]PGL90810.1 hypothetical protein CN936_25560 [Bacillus cereus]